MQNRTVDVDLLTDVVTEFKDITSSLYNLSVPKSSRATHYLLQSLNQLYILISEVFELRCPEEVLSVLLRKGMNTAWEVSADLMSFYLLNESVKNADKVKELAVRLQELQGKIIRI